MKRLFVALSVVMATLSASSVVAQTAAYKGSQAYFTPQTAIKVTVVVEKEVIEKGPYAKYSQQYLGVVAPLSDKNSFRLVSATMSGYNETDPSSIAVLGNSVPLDVVADCSATGGVRSQYKEGYPKTSSSLFTDLSIDPIVYSSASSVQSDRTSIREKSVEQMAMDAANTIFTLRKRRFDLVTGELGENVFGAGMKDAIEEMARIEQEYVSLFVGKRSVEVKSYELYLVPEVGKSDYVVCRFSPTQGVVSNDDSAAEALSLKIVPDGKVRQPAASDKKATTSGVYYRVADIATCNLVFGGEIIEAKRIPVYQYGAMLEAR